MSKQKNFTEQFKRDTVKMLSEQGYSVAKAAKLVGVSGMTIRTWHKKYASSDQTDLEKEVAALRERNRILTMERDILKKAAVYFAKEND